MFLDEATIEVSGGRGGDGARSWRREKYVPMGGPNGGDGGKGGDVILVADENTDTLSDFSSRKRFEASKARFGGGQLRGGADGPDLVLPVPPGTVVIEILTKDDGTTEEKTLGELVKSGDKMLVARGGRGGYGNAHFKSSTRQAPDFAELGEPGEVRNIRLDLKLVADVGIIGYPSVGKSTIISVISAAKPKIAAYAFTTLVPNLGVVHVSGRSYVVCDVPGLIEGASEGKGLGDKFLRHIERCGVLLHVLDLTRAMNEDSTIDPAKLIADHQAIRKELQAYSPLLAGKKELVVLHKTDIVNHETSDIEKALKKAKIPVFLAVSSATRHHVDELMKKLLKIVMDERKLRIAAEKDGKDEPAAERPILRPHLRDDRMSDYRVEKRGGAVHVSGARIEQFTVMTNFMSEDAVKRFLDVVERTGLKKAIHKHRTGSEPVWIGKTRVDAHLE